MSLLGLSQPARLESTKQPKEDSIFQIEERRS